jgi:ubiquinone/menaquinone biosynthesis C-methylase UbiE
MIGMEQTADQILMSCGLGSTLDIGSGEGALVAALLRKGVDAQGVDVSEVLVSRCNQRMPARFTHGSVLSLPFPDESFDTVVSTDCMEYLAHADVPKALQEIHRVARRFVFLRIATTQDRDNHWHLTVEDRAWWETKCFETGFRKHPAYYRINAYESLNMESGQIVILLEKIPTKAGSLYPLAALKEERDLHMDMLRKHGSRSDAHVARYHFACRYVRPGDIVLDAACGLGYGSYVIRSLTKCSSVTGIDGSAYGVDYANANFGDDSAIGFRQGYLPDCLQHIPDNSIDCVICFETLEHVEAPTLLLAEFHRILTPGGRLIASVPHNWSDETGQDPNPFHLHVYDHSKFISELTQSFEIEHLVGQTADRIKKPGGACEWVSRPRSFNELDPLCDDTPVEAEWLLAVACKSPLSGSDIPYVEKMFSQEEQAASGNALAFARDYENPWLVRALVSIGLRTENRTLRERWAIETIRLAPVTSADYGAALCVLAYLAHEGSIVTQQIELIEAIDRYISIKPGNNPNVLRWQVSLSFVRGLMELAQGLRDSAKQYFHRAMAFPAATYSPTLLTKPAEAAYLLGLLYAADGELEHAELVWQSSFNQLQKDIGQHLAFPYPALPPGFEMRELVTVLSLMGRLVAAARYAKCLNFQPSIFNGEVNADTVARLSWLAELQKGKDWLEAQWQASQEQLAQRDAEIKEIYASRSWRFTRPLRFIARLIR